MSKLLKRNKFIFNIHLLLSIIFTLPLLIIAISGSIISYESEISDFINSKNLHAEKTSQAYLKPSEILNKFKEQISSNPVRLQISNDPNRSAKVYKTRAEVYFVNPYDGKIIGKDESSEFMRTVLVLHRNLGFALFESDDRRVRLAGKHIVAVCTIVLILLCISGIWLYFPLLKKNFIKASKLNFRLKGYAFFYNLHSVIGVWLFALLTLICLTGLYWSYGWYAKGINALFASKTESKMQKGRLNAVKSYEGVDKAYEIFKENKGEEYDRVTLMIGENNSTYNIFYWMKDFKNDRAKTIQINVRDEKIIFDNAIDAPDPTSKVRLSMYELHTGYYFGEIGKFIWCVASFSVVIFVLSGFYMTFKRAFKRRRNL